MKKFFSIFFYSCICLSYVLANVYFIWSSIINIGFELNVLTFGTWAMFLFLFAVIDALFFLFFIVGLYETLFGKEF